MKLAGPFKAPNPKEEGTPAGARRPAVPQATASSAPLLAKRHDAMHGAQGSSQHLVGMRGETRPRSYVVVVGGGKVGFHLARELLQAHDEVLVVESDAERAASIRADLGDVVVIGDGCEASTLDAAGVARADIVAAVTGDDEDNLVVCEIARQRGHARTIARINHPKNEMLFWKRRIETTISATQAVLTQMQSELPGLRSSIPLLQLHRRFTLLELTLSADAPAAGRLIREILMPPESFIFLVLDGRGVARLPSGETRLDAGNIVLAVAPVEILDLLRETLVGPARGVRP